MDPDMRTALIAVGAMFCFAFAAMTVTVIAESGLDILTFTSLVIIAMVVFALWGAFRSPPR